MPRFDGTGPRGEGAFTGRGEGYCIARLPQPGTSQPIAGYAGKQGTPMQSGGVPMTRPAVSPFAGRPVLNWRRAWGMRRGRGRRFGARRARRW